MIGTIKARTDKLHDALASQQARIGSEDLEQTPVENASSVWTLPITGRNPHLEGIEVKFVSNIHNQIRIDGHCLDQTAPA